MRGQFDEFAGSEKGSRCFETRAFPVRARRRVLLVALLALAVGAGAYLRLGRGGAGPVRTPATAAAILANTPVDAGAYLSRPAPAFRLIDQFGQTVTLAQFRGRAVVLAFIDDQCATICPLTMESMVGAERLLGAAAARHMVLLAVNVNPTATSVADVRQYSAAHGLMNRWLFLTGSPATLARVWKQYGIYTAVIHGVVDHTPALYVIAPNGRERWVAETAMEYRAVNTEALVLARVVQGVLPHAAVKRLPRLTVPPPPSPKTASIPAITASGRHGTVALAGHGPTLVVFAASWAPELAANWRTLAAQARAHANIRVVVVDIGTVEPSSTAFERFMAANPSLPPMTVAYDATGQLADALGAQNIPESVLLTGGGRVLWRSQSWPITSSWARFGQLLAKAGKG